MIGELLSHRGGRCVRSLLALPGAISQMINKYPPVLYTNCHLQSASMKTPPPKTAKPLQNKPKEENLPSTQAPAETLEPRCPP